MQVQENYQIILGGSRRYARGGDGLGVGLVVHGGAWWCLECLVVLRVPLSHKNHDLHLDVRCCDLHSMENPRHSSHKSEPITPWPPQLPQLTRQAIPPSPISLQHPCPRSRQTMPIMGLSEFCRRRLSPSPGRAGDIPLPAPPTRETRHESGSRRHHFGSLQGHILIDRNAMIYICSPTSAVRLLPPPAILAAAYRLAHLLLVLEETIPSIPFLASGISGFPDPQ
jgi:hypothetical protein